MALPIETPSRIWRRIRDAEAHEVDMPSLPSLPALDDSSISDLHHPSFSLEKDQRPSEPVISVIRRSETRPSAALPPINRDRTPSTDPTVTSIVPSFPGDPHEEEYDDINEDIFSSNKHSSTGENDNGRDVSKSNQQQVDNGIFHAAYTGSETGQSSKPTSVARVSLSGKSSTTAVDPPEDVVEPYGNPVPTDKSQGLHISGDCGFPSNAMNMPDFRDVVMRRPYGSTQQAISLPSLPPSSPPLSSPQFTSDSHLPVWTSEVRENFSDHELDAVAVRPAVTKEDDRAREIGMDQQVEDEAGETTEKVTRSREPTFTSEEVESTRETGIRFSQATIYPAGWSTPAQSDQPSILEKGSKATGHGVEDDLTTPLPRKKSFLLSVVNSTTRPRLSAPTPHPGAKQKIIGISVGTTPRLSYVSHARGRNARLSHPLSQFSVFAPSTPLNAIPTGTEPDDIPDGVTSSSFVSTASSHDLTVHHRANASFDPLTGPQGVGRFNAGKLNTYLHGLNRRLQKENELLVDKVKSLQTEYEILYDRGRHRELSGVMEDEAAEQWVLERESFEQKIVELEKQLEARHKELSEEQLLRMQDKERWKKRMSEVEDGVGQIVSDLEKRVEEAETRSSHLKDVERQMQVVQSEFDTAKADCRLFKQRAEQAEQLLANADKRESNVLRLAGGEPSNLGLDMRNCLHQLEEKDQHIATLQLSLADKEKEILSLQIVIRDLESSLRITRETIETSQKDAKERRTEQKEAEEELRAAQATIDILKRESRSASDAVGDLEQQLAATKQRLAEKEEALNIANGRITGTSDELEKARSVIQQLETALEESDRKILSDNNEMLNLRSKISVMKREQDNLKESEQSQAVSLQNAAEIEALEVELMEARKEIGRLNTLLEHSPARKALNKAKESRIDLLEKENQELLEQLRAARDPSYYMTPHRSAAMSGLSPMHRRLINLTLRTPKTPGEPLRNVSWLNATGEITTVHLFDEIGRLQRELDLANESIDDKLDKLEEAGLGVVGLTKALEDARQRIINLENQLEERGLSLCPQCVERGIEKSITRDPNATLQLRLTMVTAELEALRKQRDDEMASSSGEKAVLRDATNRLNIEIKRAKEELKAAQERGYKTEKSRKELQQELTRARKTINDLEYYLQTERSRLRTMSVENSNAVKERGRILEKLYETEQKMEQTKDHLFQLKETNIKLEAKLRIERESANIEETLIGNRETIERLRQERSQLFDKYYDLQQKLTSASKNASDLATKHAKLQLSYDGRRRQLDRQAEEIESLRAALSSQVQAIDAPWVNKKAEIDDDKLKDLASRLQSELKRIQQEANRFGRDLVHLKSERDNLIVRHREELEQHERETKHVRAQLRSLKQRLTSREENKDFATEIQLATESLRLRHNRECKGLFVQIRYLKAKFTREAALRDDLGYQKGYLLVLLSRYEKSEKKILASIAQIGPISTPAKTVRSKSLRTVALAVIFVSRTRRVSEAWREQRSACSAVAAALDNVRKNRPLKA